jgi:PAS domain S-box-containing protein
MHIYPDSRRRLLQFLADTLVWPLAIFMIGLALLSFMVSLSEGWLGLLIGLLSTAVFLLYVYMRRRIDDLLQQSQASLELAQSVAHLGSWELDIATGRGTWSKEMSRLFHRDPSANPPVFEEFIQGVYPEDRDAVQAALRRVGETGERVTVEHRYNSTQEGVRHFEVTVHAVKDAQGRPLRIAGTVLDITARKQTEARLSKLNRTYALLSEINQLIVRVREPTTLFDAACRTAVEQGGFRMAWIGQPDPQTRQVRPVAHAGAAEGYLENLQIVVDDSDMRDSYVSALRAGQHVVVNDISKDLRMGPWRASAVRLGYRASAVFPLIVAGKIYGALNLYASELDFFDQDELKLLDEMVADIAFAIEFIEQEQQRQQSDEKLRASEARYRMLAENTSDVIWQMDVASGRFTYVSPSVQRLRGYTPEEVMALPPSMALTPESAREVGERMPLHLASFQANNESIQSWVSELDQPHRDGHIVPTEVVTTFLRDAQTGALTVLGVSRDITARRRAEEALIEERNSLARRVNERTADLSRANSELARAVQAKDEFLANMSHELRTPLNAILALSESLLEQFRGPLNQRQQESLRNIETTGRHLLALINDILDLSKVESGRLELHSDIVVIADVCETSLLFVKELAIKKQLQLAFQLSDQTAIMRADPKRLKQMLVNLLSNAVKFTEPGGRVCLEVNTDAEAGVIRFAIEDTGIGIPSAELARLFQPFIQLDSSLSRQHEGTGLGLALVRRLAEMHGGSVSVQSEVGKGSCFLLALPYHAPTPPEATNGPAPLPITAAEPPPAAVRILLAEDNEINIIAIGDYLQDRGYHVAVAHNGREALDMVAVSRPDVILMDIQMPDMDGLEATRRLRAMPNYVDTPIIALTALAMPGDRERCLAAGANEYLTKPVSLKGLVTTIQRWLT